MVHAGDQSGGSVFGAANKIAETKNLHLRKRRMKANSTVQPKTVRRGWPHPSLCGEVDAGRSKENERNHDERNQTGILTSGINLAPPSRFAAIIEAISGFGSL
jgi:hypothetical protein